MKILQQKSDELSRTVSERSVILESISGTRMSMERRHFLKGMLSMGALEGSCVVWFHKASGAIASPLADDKKFLVTVAQDGEMTT